MGTNSVLEEAVDAPATPRPRVLISEINATDQFFLPYVSSILKSYWQRHSAAPEAYEWLEPLWIRSDAEGDLDLCLTETPDIVGLSCYTWNWDLQLKVARWARQRNPACLVVAGGPDPDYKDPRFFEKYPEIDIVVVRDGEIPFNSILEAYLRGERDFSHIPGLYLPSPAPGLRLFDDPASAHLYTGAPQVPTEFDHSPYLDHAPMYERLMAEHGHRMTMAILETNRGCPYSCNYCDWGSSTMAKIRKFGQERVEAEIDWLGKMGVKFLFLADANFGILPRDVGLADRLAETREKYGYPLFMYYSSAKNNTDRTVEIAQRTYDAKLTTEHVLAVQHTDVEVLAGTGRSNIAPGKYRELVRGLSQHGIPSQVQLIFGIPGDTVEKWKNCLAELMDWGVHENYQISYYSLLPNAPAAEPGFKAKWQMRTIDRQLVPYSGLREKNGDSYTSNKIVVGWKGFEDADWVEAITYSVFVRALHNRALTRLPAIYLHHVHGVPYREYYDAVIDGFYRNSPAFGGFYARVRTLYERFIREPEMTDAMELDDFPQSTFLVEPSRWLYATTALRRDAFYSELTRFLCSRYPQARSLKSAIDYQKQLAVQPDYQSSKGKSFTLDRDWPAFFATVRDQAEFAALQEPRRFLLPCSAELAPEDRPGRKGVHEFGDGSAEERRNEWLAKCVGWASSAQTTNHAAPHLKPRFAVAPLLRLSRA